jgi:hypothetical protein
MNASNVERVAEIKNEIKTLLEEAFNLIRFECAGDNSTSVIYERARSYWYAHIAMALDKEHNYLGGSMFTMQDTIDDMQSYIEDEENCEDEEEENEE